MKAQLDEGTRKIFILLARWNEGERDRTSEAIMPIPRISETTELGAQRSEIAEHDIETKTYVGRICVITMWASLNSKSMKCLELASSCMHM